MKPTQEQILNSLSKLIKENKTELQAEGKVKVELSLIDDLVSDAKRMKKGIQELDALRQKMKKVYLNAIDNANTNRSEFGKKAKELGIDPNDVKEYKDFFSLQEKLDSAYYNPNK